MSSGVAHGIVLAWVTLIGDGPAPVPEPRIDISPKTVYLYYPQDRPASPDRNEFIDESNTMQVFRATLRDSLTSEVEWLVDGVLKVNAPPTALFKYDVTGGRYEETDYFAQGSGGKDARDSLKKRFKRDMSRDEALRVSIEALIDAADEDLGTGGPDLMRGILPSVKTITRSGFAEAPEDEIRRHCEAILNDRNRL